jgi:hypothetical protein
MCKRFLILLLWGAFGYAEIVDRISVIVDGQIIKHSDIMRDIRLTDLLNHENLNLDVNAQKKAAARLIDQALIRKELAAGLYPSPDPSEVDALLSQFKQSLGSEAAYQRALTAYGVREDDLRKHLYWQISVLRFINLRFATSTPAADADVRTYYQQHLPDFRRAGKPKLDLESLRPEIEQTLAGERVNQQFFAWLDESEKSTPITYNEESLK